MVDVGDCDGRLNKDGIGSAYRVAKTAAVTALFKGISDKDFRQGYWPLCRAIRTDNRYGRIIFDFVAVVKKSRLLTRAVMRMARSETNKSPKDRRMSRVLWDMFTGSAPYREVFISCLHPGFWGRFILRAFVDPGPARETNRSEEETMDNTGIGKDYRSGEVIFRQGEIGDSMYVIQSGQVEVIQTKEGKEVRLAVLGEKDIFGEMALFQKETRSATVRALTNVRALTVDRRIFLRRVHEDPSFVFGVLQKMSQRIRDLDGQLTHLKAEYVDKSTSVS
jgi:CRP/FNR family transcriptional regulator